MDDGAWFAAKRLGYGAGLPIAWQGWALLAVLVGAIVGLARALVPAHPGYFVGAVFALGTLLMPLFRAKTRGGWKWRGGRN